MSTHLPLRILRRPFHRQCLFLRPQLHPHAAMAIPVQLSVANENGRRQLSSTSYLKRFKTLGEASGGNSSLSINVQESPGTTMQQLVADPNWLPDDHGLTQGTLVRLPLREQWNMFKNPTNWGGALYYQWRLAKQRVLDLFWRMRYKWWINKGHWKRKPKMARRPIKKDAKILYETLWKAFAQKDEEKLNGICCDPIMDPIREQWATRPPNHIVSWKLEKHHLGSPRVVSNKASDISMSNFQESAIRQVVLQFKTRQTITTQILPKDMGQPGEDIDGWVRRPIERGQDRNYRYKWSPAGPEDVTEKEEEDEVKTTSRTVDVVEYMVVQRIMKRGFELEWQVYGFVQPTTLEDIAEDDEDQKRNEAYLHAHPELYDL